ncbi:MAG: DALR domain-containing protein, partial [Pseudomonadota bacterium]
AQSCCAYGTEVLANVWMHNGFLQVEGEKMSKSLGNFITIHDLLATDGFGGQKWPGRVLRWAMLATHYRQPLDWTVDRLTQARNTLADFADLIADVPPSDAPNDDVIAALLDDLNTPSAMSIVHGIAKSARRGNTERAADLSATLRFLGLYGGETREDFMAGRAVHEVDETQVEALVAERLEARKAKNWAESDRLRDELAALGVQVKDSKDPQSGEAISSWEIAR